MNDVICGDASLVMKELDNEAFHLLLSDIPYGISFDDWDIKHTNTNSALGGVSPAQKKSSSFRSRGKPINGWSSSDRKIGEEYKEWCSQWASEAYRILIPGASVFIFAGRRFQHKCVDALEEAGFLYRDMIAWEKPTAPFRAQRVSAVFERRGDSENTKRFDGWRLGNLRPTFEPILWFMKPYKIGGTITDNLLEYGVGAFKADKWKDYTLSCENIIRSSFDKGDHGLHVAQKPLVLMEALIELTTQEGMNIIDPFCGSGTTLEAAKRLNRNFIGIDVSEEFVKISKKRVFSC